MVVILMERNKGVGAAMEGRGLFKGMRGSRRPRPTAVCMTVSVAVSVLVPRRKWCMEGDKWCRLRVLFLMEVQGSERAGTTLMMMMMRVRVFTERRLLRTRSALMRDIIKGQEGCGGRRRLRIVVVMLVQRNKGAGAAVIRRGQFWHVMRRY